jgi:hypothetical protein
MPLPIARRSRSSRSICAKQNGEYDAFIAECAIQQV